MAQRTRALAVVKAAARLKIIAARIRAGSEAADGPTEVLLPPEVLSIENNGAAPVYTRPSRLSDPGMARAMSAVSHTSLEAVERRWFMRDYLAIQQLLTSSWVNVLLIAIPLGFISEGRGWGPIATFGLNFCSLIPLALILGDITEDLALRFGQVIGGLINATFGNVVELILSVSALYKGLNTVVATSLIGSILSNLLLVLGCSFFFGGLYNKTQTFNAMGNRACSSLLMLACVGIIIPTAATTLASSQGEEPNTDWELELSRGTAIVLLLCYVAYLVFQLRTHKDLFQGEEDEEEPMLSLGTSVVLLAIITVIVAAASEFLTGSIEEVKEQTKLPEAFLGMIILPIAGNACEHITAVIVATKNKMDLSLGVAVGSSIQIALFAIPFIVIVGWITGHDFSLCFDSFSALVLTVCVIHSNFVTADATSHWLLGAQLVAVYCLIALAYYYR